MNTQVKICGLTREEDVQCAVDCGADYVGFVLYNKSPRYVEPKHLEHLTRSIPAGVRRVGVVVNPDAALLRQAMEAGGLDIIQFHGEETDTELQALTGITPWKALPLGCEADLTHAQVFTTEVVVADAAGHAARGGTGKRCNWQLAARLAARRTVFLAGGITADNVALAIQAVHPAGVDVSSGVEDAPRRKNHDLVRRFVTNAKSAGNTLP